MCLAWAVLGQCFLLPSATINTSQTALATHSQVPKKQHKEEGHILRD